MKRNAVSKLIMNTLRKPVFDRMWQLEASVGQREGSIHAVETSPERFEIIENSFRRGQGPDLRVAPVMPQIVRGVMHSLSSLDENPAHPKTEISRESLEELIAFVKSMGISSVGFTAVPRQWIFKGKAVLHDNAIVLTMEMDKERIDTAPSIDAQMTVMETYRDLGVVTNKAAGFLRQHGFSAHAGHPLNGLALYPPLAQMAGLGWLGASGLIIGPEYGPRFRLSAVFTSITNLPPAQENDHAWIGDYCAQCGLCVEKCPVGAIYREPITRDSGQITYVDDEKCFPYFSDFYGCSVCISVCPFNHVPYSTLKAGSTPSAPLELAAG